MATNENLSYDLGVDRVNCSFFQNPILNIDIAPTIVELGGGKAPQSMDGRSILPLLVGLKAQKLVVPVAITIEVFFVNN